MLWFFKAELLHSSFLKHNSNQNCSRSFKLNCISTVALFTTNDIGGKTGGIQYITAFPIIKSNAGVHTTQPTLFDVSAAITEQSPPLRYLSPGFFTVNKPRDKCLHSKATFHLLKPYFHFSELKVKLITLLTCFQAEQIGAVLLFWDCRDWRKETG